MYIDNNKPLMPKAVAMWLINNTALTFQQIADFCGIDVLQIKAMADGEGDSASCREIDPIASGQLSKNEIDRCVKNPTNKLVLNKSESRKILEGINNKSGRKFTPMAKRQDKPDAIYWLIKNFPDLEDTKIAKIVGSTKGVVSAIRSKTYWNMNNLKQRDPVLIGLCSQSDLNRMVEGMENKSSQINYLEDNPVENSDISKYDQKIK